MRKKDWMMGALFLAMGCASCKNDAAVEAGQIGRASCRERVLKLV